MPPVSWRSHLSTDNLNLISYVQLLCGDKAKAAIARRVPRDVSEPIYLTSLAAVGDLADAADLRDAALERYCTSFQEKSPKSAQVYQLVRNAISAQKPGALDLKAIDAILEKMPTDRKANMAFVVAWRLTASNRLDEAKRFWVTVSEGKQTNFWWRVFALSTLAQSLFAAPRRAEKAPGGLIEDLGGILRHVAVLPDDHRRHGLAGSLDDYGCGLPKGERMGPTTFRAANETARFLRPGKGGWPRSPLVLFLAWPARLLKLLRELSFQFLGGMFHHLAILPDDHRRPGLPGSLDDLGCGLSKGRVGLLCEALPGLGAHGAILHQCVESGRKVQRPQSSGFPRPPRRSKPGGAGRRHRATSDHSVAGTVGTSFSDPMRTVAARRPRERRAPLDAPAPCHLDAAWVE